jgi:GTPase SAR1 family protein
VASKWTEEISDNCPGVKLVLTALKCDLRKDENLNDNQSVIAYEQGLAKAKEIGAVKYLGGHSFSIHWTLLIFSDRVLRCAEPRH